MSSLRRKLEPELMDTAAEAISYDDMDHAEVNRLFVDDLIDAAARDLASDAEILDVGTGTAQIPIELCHRRVEVRVLAIDGATSMLDVAIGSIDIAGLRDRIMLARVDAKELPYDDERFPIVMSNSVVHHVPEPMQVLQEAVRVTRRGGLLFFRDLLRPADEAQLSRLVREYAGEADDFQRKMFADSLQAALTLEEVQAMVQEFGFPRESVLQTSDRHWTWSARRLV